MAIVGSHNDLVQAATRDDILTFGLIPHVRVMMDLSFPDINELELEVWILRTPGGWMEIDAVTSGGNLEKNVCTVRDCGFAQALLEDLPN